MQPFLRDRCIAGIAALAMTAFGGCASSATPVPESETAAAGWPGAQGADHGQVADGRKIAEQSCKTCHAIDRTSHSADAAAPPLREVLDLYEADNLAYRFIEGMRVGHDEMPVFDMDIRTADALIAYIGSISGPRPGR